MYWIAIFGSPAGETWAWRFGGHHVSLHYTIVDGEVVGTTPCFFGADPASSPLLGPHLHRPLAGAEDIGRDLVQALSAEQRAAAIVSSVPPVDLVGGNRRQLGEGDTTLDLPLIWRGRLQDDLHAAMTAAHREAVDRLGSSASDLEAVAFSPAPKGLPSDRLDAGQQELLRALLDVYLRRIPDEVAALEAAKYAGAGVEELSFLWAGGIEAGQPHYYRIQGADLFVEYDNTQRDVNHVHSVWRGLRTDFGRDVLAEHYSREH
jgi:hypothetical protein